MALCDKTVLGNPGEKRGRRDTHREICSESLRSDDSNNAYNEGDDDLPPAKRRKLYEAPALIASPRFRRPPSSTSLEMDDTQSQADNGCPSTFVNNEQHHASYTSQNSSMPIKDRFSKEDEEFEELAMDDYSQQGHDTDGSDNSADEDYSRDIPNNEDEDFRPVKRSKLPSPPHRRHRAFWIPTERGNARSKHICHPVSKANEQLCSPQSSQSPPPPSAESIPFAEYEEYAVNGVFKFTRIGTNATFNLELRVADLSEHFKFTGPLKAMSTTLAAKVSSQAQIPSLRHAISTHHRQRQPPKQQVESSTQPQTTQRPITSSGILRKKAHPQRRTQWIEEEITVVDMRKRNASWKEISVAVPSHSLGSITGHYYGTLRKRT
jgi:hypothetical protein